jgi:hypothetical protein
VATPYFVEEHRLTNASEPRERKVPASAMREHLEKLVKRGELVGAIDDQRLD